MSPDSRQLAHQIDTMVAFQNKEDTEFRERRLPSETQATWATSAGNLGFNWQKYEYRTKAATPREGYVFERSLHKHPDRPRHTTEDTCFLVREVLGDNE